MSKAKQTERKEIGRIKLSDTQELVAFVVENKKFRFIIVDEENNKKVELSIVDKRDELKEINDKRDRLKHTALVYVSLVGFLILMNFVARHIWRVGPWWWLLPAILLGVGLFLQFLDVFYLDLANKLRNRRGRI